jgi:predicted nuclease of restriction endonuclease-like (RecB) superfamily
MKEKKIKTDVKKKTAVDQVDFTEILLQIKQARQKAYTQVNTTLIELYWNIGKIISQKVHHAGWGKGIVTELADYITKNEPNTVGFSDKNLWRMKQFFEVYEHDEKLATLWRELSWSHNRLILPLKQAEEREFYLKLAISERYSVRELERQINASFFERTMLGDKKITSNLKTLHPAIDNTFKDSYVFEFLGLPQDYNESHFQKALIQHMKKFILELGRDFLFVGEEYRLQVGNSDFFIDLLFYHRGLSALVAFELKTEKFKPEHLGQINFYLEALDRDIKKPQENPSIGLLLCSDKDDEVVEYALSRHLSPTLVAHYTTLLPDKRLLQTKLHELTEMLEKKIDD